MLDPFTAWSRMVTVGLDMQTMWLNGLETMGASHIVIDARTRKMREAASAPMHTDVVEFSRMVPEKVDAFGRSAQAFTREAMAMQRAWATQVQRIGLTMMSGKIPTMAETSRLASQTAEYTLGAMTAGARLGKTALAPIHRTATGNARRLGMAKPKAARK